MTRLKRLPGLPGDGFAPLVAATLRGERNAFVAGEQPSEIVKGDSKGGPKGGRVLIGSYNIHKAVGTDRRFDPHRIVQVIREIGADVIALQEADQRFGERAGLLDLALLKRECGLVPVPIGRPQRGHGWHGNVVLFREGAVRAINHIVLPGVEPRGALVVDLDLPAGPLRIIAAHLGLLRVSRARQVEALLAAAAAQDGRPALLMGDLNEWRMGPRSSLHGLAPLFGPLHAAIPSFPSRFPVLALDRILGHPHSLIRSVRLHDTPLSRIASDHMPLKAEVELPGVQRQAAAAR